MMANLAAIDEFGHFRSQQPVAAIGTGGRRQIALELHGRVILGSSLTLRRLANCSAKQGRLSLLKTPKAKEIMEFLWHLEF